MKIMKMVLLAFVLLATACTQSTTTPTAPPATTNPCGYSTNSNEFIELKINGKTLRNESLMLNGTPYHPLVCSFGTELGRRLLSIRPILPNTCITDTVDNLTITLNAEKSSNFQDPIGIYNLSGACSGAFTYNPTRYISKYYQIPFDSLTLNVTSCTTDYVSGTFVGTAFEIGWTTPIPFTGSFNNLKRNGF